MLEEAGNETPFVQNISMSTLTFFVMLISTLRHLFMKKMNQGESFQILYAAWETIRFKNRFHSSYLPEEFIALRRQNFLLLLYQLSI